MLNLKDQIHWSREQISGYQRQGKGMGKTNEGGPAVQTSSNMMLYNKTIIVNNTILPIWKLQTNKSF